MTHSDAGLAVDGGGSGAELVRQRIVARARAHFFAHGFRGVTMDDLADELAMSKRTLYIHFTSKQALLETVLDAKIQSIDADLGQVVAGSARDFPEALRALLGCFRKHAEELQPPFLRDMARETPELFQSVQVRRRALFQRHFGALLSTGNTTGMIRGDISPELMIEILLGATDALVNPQKLSQLGIPAETCITAIITLFLEGVVVGRGRRRA